MFKKIGAIILLVRDIKQSSEFYRDVLGMQLKHDSDDWVEFSKGTNTVLALHPARKTPNTQKRTGMLVGFNVTDLDDVCRELENKKVKFYKKQTEETFGKHAIIEDPDGHLISLVELSSKEEFSQIPYYHGFAPV
ncbi:MAG: VOC family protein [Candidatus Nitrosopolaris sp.]|jgi:lactoylglutathione lyase